MSMDCTGVTLTLMPALTVVAMTQMSVSGRASMLESTSVGVSTLLFGGDNSFE